MAGADQQCAYELESAAVIERASCAHCDEPVVLLCFSMGTRYWTHDNGRDGYYCAGSNMDHQTFAEPRREG